MYTLPYSSSLPVTKSVTGLERDKNKGLGSMGRGEEIPDCLRATFHLLFSQKVVWPWLPDFKTSSQKRQEGSQGAPQPSPENEAPVDLALRGGSELLALQSECLHRKWGLTLLYLSHFKRTTCNVSSTLRKRQARIKFQFKDLLFNAC